ncbi:hypothetical protein V8B97DRAFT_1917582 [Scleroderma yunnanense]
MATHHRTTGRRSAAAADVITYRLDDKMMYVPLDFNWGEALRHARRAFEKLAKIDEKRITFSVNIVKEGQRSSVGITPSAWQSVASHLARYEIIDITITPEVIVTDTDAPPPRYSYSVEKGNSSVEARRRSRSPSPALSTTSNSSSKLNPKRVLQRLYNGLT